MTMNDDFVEKRKIEISERLVKEDYLKVYLYQMLDVYKKVLKKNPNIESAIVQEWIEVKLRDIGINVSYDLTIDFEQLMQLHRDVDNVMELLPTKNPFKVGRIEILSCTWCGKYFGDVRNGKVELFAKDFPGMRSDIVCKKCQIAKRDLSRVMYQHRQNSIVINDDGLGLDAQLNTRCYCISRPT